MLDFHEEFSTKGFPRAGSYPAHCAITMLRTEEN